VVCFPHYGGIVEWIEALGIGFVIETWDDLERVADDPVSISAATRRCLACRDRFTNEHNAGRIRGFVGPLLEGRRPAAAPSPRSLDAL